MTEQEFQRLMRLAKLAPGDYSAGYQRGLRRLYHGENFGTAAEHEKWLALGLDDPRADQGNGYRDGFAGKWPAGIPNAQKLAGGKRVNVYLDTASLSVAEALGNGNVSAGIRIALNRGD